MRGATTTAASISIAYIWFQSTPLCEGRLNSRSAGRYFEYCFNPRPCARGDSESDRAPHSFVLFQSTPLCEGRLQAAADAVASSGVSIHAPVRGATSVTCYYLVTCSRFNPRPCARGDIWLWAVLPLLSLFQSTPLCEGRPPRLITSTSLPLFQSTPLCEGRPGSNIVINPATDVSIHAPVRGATNSIHNKMTR